MSPWKKLIVTRSNKQQKENNSFCFLVAARLRSTLHVSQEQAYLLDYLNTLTRVLQEEEHEWVTIFEDDINGVGRNVTQLPSVYHLDQETF